MKSNVFKDCTILGPPNLQSDLNANFTVYTLFSSYYYEFVIVEIVSSAHFMDMAIGKDGTRPKNELQLQCSILNH
jgi:hypothetical protein